MVVILKAPYHFDRSLFFLFYNKTMSLFASGVIGHPMDLQLLLRHKSSTGADASSNAEAKLAFANKVHELLGEKEAIKGELKTEIKGATNAAKAKLDSDTDEKRKTAMEALTKALTAMDEKVVEAQKKLGTKLAELGAVAVGPTGPIVQYYQPGSGIIQLHSMSTLETWRDSLIRNAGGVGILQLMRPSCPACARIKEPLQQAIEMAGAPHGLMAAIDVSCLSLPGCPLAHYIKSDLSPYWNSYIPAFIGVKVQGTGFNYFKIEDAGSTLDSLVTMLRQQLALDNFAKYNEKLTAVEDNQLAQKALYERFGNLASVLQPSLEGDSTVDSRLRNLQRDFEPVMNWMQYADANKIFSEKELKYLASTDKKLDRSLVNALDHLTRDYIAFAGESDGAQTNKLCQGLASLSD